MKRPSAGGKGNPWRCFARWGVGTFLLSAAHTAGLYGPWGVAAVAAAGGRVQGAWALLGAVAGALVFFNFQTGLRFAASAVLAFAVNLAFCDTALYKRREYTPLLAAVSLFAVQTVYLAGSIVAIFMKQLNFSQVMRLITGISMPTQITGYMDQLLKLMAKLDTGAVLANLAIRIPDILMCLGLWMIVFAARSKKAEMPGVGFTFLKIVVIIGLIKSCVLMLAGLVISVALVVSAWVSGVQTMIVAAVVTLVIMIVLTMFVVMYYFSYLAMLRTFRTNTQKGESYGTASGYVAVVYILMGLFGIIGLLSGIVNGEISGIVGSAGRIGWMLLMAFWIFGYRNTLGEIED